MKNRFLLLLSALAALFLSAACSVKEDFLVTNLETTGNLVDGRFLSDQGIWYDVVEQTCDGDLKAEERALIVCDILKNNSTSYESAYNIRLKNFVSVGLPQVKDGIAEGLSRHPVYIDLAWVSGTYLNFRVIYLSEKNSDFAHSFTFVVEKAPDSTQPLVLRLCHEAGEDYLGAEGKDSVSAFVQKTAYISIQLYDYYKNSLNYSYYYTVKYDWYKTGDNGDLTPETEERTVEGNLL